MYIRIKVKFMLIKIRNYINILFINFKRYDMKYEIKFIFYYINIYKNLI